MEKIELQNVKKMYKNKVVAVKEMNAVFEQGKFYAVMGPSGSGKSTLLNMIGTIESITEGKILWKGRDISKLNQKEQDIMRKEQVGFLFQGFYLNPYLTARENVEIPMYLLENMSKKQRRNRAEALLAQFGLIERSTHFPEEMSGGEQQRVCMARALANNPEIVLADEPTGNLDEENEKIIFSKLKELAENGKIVIVVSHNEAVKLYADTIIQMKKE